MRKQHILIIVFLIIGFCLHGQNLSIVINADNIPIKEVLEQLREQYNFHFSYSEDQLSGYRVNISKTFHSEEEAIQYLFKDLPFKIHHSDEVFIIIPIKNKTDDKNEKQKEKFITISGQIVEAGSYEPLPYSHVFINNHALVSNVMGSIKYSYPSAEDSSVHFKISHLGYYIFDTVLYASIDKQFVLTPSSYDIPEVTVKNSEIENSTQIGESPAKIKLNYVIAKYLPGQGDNSIFNLLRLMPGIQAAGEQTSEPLTWGSYEGQTQIIFDGFLLFGLKNYNDYISVVNPLMVKNIEIFKSAYDARYSNSVGGIIDITGKNGNLKKPAFCVNLNPTTINGVVEVPIHRKSSLMMAYRQTYYNLYNPDDFNIFEPSASMLNKRGKGVNNDINVDLNIYPDAYNFRDFNLKYSVHPGDGDLFHFSLYNGGDFFSLATETEVDLNKKHHNPTEDSNIINVKLRSTEKNRQYGGAVFYGKNWKDGMTSNIILSHSGLTKTVADNFESEVPDNFNFLASNASSLENETSEFSLKQENAINLTNSHKFEFGTGLYLDNASYINSFNENDTLKIDTVNTFKNNRYFVYLHDSRTLWNKWNIKAGLYANYITTSNLLKLEPRFSTTYKITKTIKASMAWGIYNQYLYKQETVDRDNNYTYLWITSDENIKPLHAVHYVAGLTYFKNNFTVNIEGYSKFLTSLTRRIYVENTGENQLNASYSRYNGNSKATGIDIFVKKDWKNYVVWASYTLSKTVEQFHTGSGELSSVEYQAAPHDQRHEFKTAGLVNFGKWYFSLNYVYGSGMQMLKTTFPDQKVRYSRLDAATTYKFGTLRYKAEIGLSILNVLNTQNLKYTNLKSIQISPQMEKITVYTSAVPFTPTLFVKLSF